MQWLALDIGGANLKVADGLGHAESLMNVSTAFNLKHLKNDMVYQKPLRDTMNVRS